MCVVLSGFGELKASILNNCGRICMQVACNSRFIYCGRRRTNTFVWVASKTGFSTFPSPEWCVRHCAGPIPQEVRSLIGYYTAVRRDNCYTYHLAQFGLIVLPWLLCFTYTNYDPWRNGMKQGIPTHRRYKPRCYWGEVVAAAAVPCIRRAISHRLDATSRLFTTANLVCESY